MVYLFIILIQVAFSAAGYLARENMAKIQDTDIFWSAMQGEWFFYFMVFEVIGAVLSLYVAKKQAIVKFVPLIYSANLIGNIFIGVCFLNEAFNIKTLISLILVIAGIFFITRRDDIKAKEVKSK